MTDSRITYLFYRYFDNTATSAEKQELMELVNVNEYSEDIQQLMQEAWETFIAEREVFSQETSQKMLEQVFASNSIGSAPVHLKLLRWSKYAAAAIVIILATAAFWFFSSRSQKTINYSTAANQKQDLLPGKNSALLTLADGKQVVLVDASTGKLALQGNTEIIKSDNGQLQYLSLNSDNKQEVLYNTLSIPRGGQYKVVLPDGTQVWLNAASSLKYPTAFNGNERVVQLEGEAYFEVAKNAAQPFRVEVKDVKVTVLGTHFNINGYTDEAHIKTTLLEGSVKISKGPVQQLLHPGEQAITGKSSTIEVVKANSDEVLAWKNGYFNFHRSNLQEVMRQLSRWYDVDIKYEGKVPDREFGGEISRNSKASEVLKILELSDVHFRIEGEHIIVMP